MSQMFNQTVQVLLVLVVIGLVGGVTGHTIHARSIVPAVKPIKRIAYFGAANNDSNAVVEKYVSLGWVGDACVGVVAAYLAYAIVGGTGSTLIIGGSTFLTLSIYQMGATLAFAIGGSAAIEKLLTSQFDSAFKNAVMGANRNGEIAQNNISIY